MSDLPLYPSGRARFTDLPGYLRVLRDRLRILREAITPLERALTPRPERERVVIHQAAIREVLDKKKKTPGPVSVFMPPDKEKRYVLVESLWSRRRLRPFIIIAGVLLLVLGIGAALYFNSAYEGRNFAQKTVRKMQDAASYKAVGKDTIKDVMTTTEVTEQLQYVSPDQVSTSYTTSTSQTAGGATNIVDRQVIVLGTVRYQQIVSGTDESNWQVDTFNPAVLTTATFQPWQRFAWLKDIKEESGQPINGAPCRVFSGRVDSKKEADAIWGKGVKLTEPANLARAKFIEEAIVDITVWVRKEDGYIARFSMTKSYPGSWGTSNEQLDYTYSDFNQLSSISPPNTSQADETSSTGQQANPEFAMINGQIFRLEVASDEATRAKGLSSRTALPEDTAMLFVFPNEGNWELWMKNVLFRLDVLFLDSNRKIVDIQTMVPEPGVSDANLYRYSSAVPFLYAIEMNAGLAQRFRFTAGMEVQFDPVIQANLDTIPPYSGSVAHLELRQAVLNALRAADNPAFARNLKSLVGSENLQSGQIDVRVYETAAGAGEVAEFYRTMLTKAGWTLMTDLGSTGGLQFRRGSAYLFVGYLTSSELSSVGAEPSFAGFVLLLLQ